MQEVIRKNVEYYEHHAEKPRLKHTLFTKLILKHCPKDCKILDIGCSSGSVLMTLKKFGITGFRIEISRKRCEVARSFGLNVICADITIGFSNYFKEGFFDVVCSYHVFEHLTREERRFVISEIKNVLKEDGMVIVVTPFKDKIENWDVTCPNCKTTFNWKGHVASFNKGDLANEFIAGEFKLVDEFIHTPLLLTSRIPLFLLKRVMDLLYKRDYHVGLWEIISIFKNK